MNSFKNIFHLIGTRGGGVRGGGRKYLKERFNRFDETFSYRWSRWRPWWGQR
jgi:hypothetical protein